MTTDQKEETEMTGLDKIIEDVAVRQHNLVYGGRILWENRPEDFREQWRVEAKKLLGIDEDGLGEILAAFALLSAVQCSKDTNTPVEIAGVRIERCDERGVTSSARTADARYRFWKNIAFQTQFGVDATAAQEEYERYDRLTEFAEFLVSLDDDDPDSPGRVARKSIGLNDITEGAKKALGKAA